MLGISKCMFKLFFISLFILSNSVLAKRLSSSSRKLFEMTKVKRSRLTSTERFKVDVELKKFRHKLGSSKLSIKALHDYLLKFDRSHQERRDLEQVVNEINNNPTSAKNKATSKVFLKLVEINRLAQDFHIGPKALRQIHEWSKAEKDNLVEVLNVAREKLEKSEAVTAEKAFELALGNKKKEFDRACK